ncbi:aldehyde dehydrogenase family protein [Acinetobacter sp. MD2(2019)]|uniref:aldehyde dehydrogenase family protein n=1 Tax=Acinetobacter sp. MD2(2019) TaxID=2605273 RepID=UPI002D1F493A|nr:aldehyde dehydrogenase family protein [Acinetobacter sp. MD2(2019)]MEB3753572.1 aldehyde dehydrogenase family protein [Acinetobacter sp. MD2(2019)]
MQNYDKLFINGRWVLPVHPASFDSIDPSNEQVITQVAAASPSDVELAVEAARQAFDSGIWSGLSGTQRAHYLHAIATEIRNHLTQLASLEVQDNGKPYPEAEWDINDAADCFDFYAKLAVELDTQREQDIALPDVRFHCVARKEPVGVACAIIPWNYPLLMAAWKVAPALAAGCTLILKPAEATSLTAIELGRIAEKVQLPAGVLNILTGIGADIGPALTEHPHIDKVAFTGSVPVGKQIMQSAAHQVKNISLELGGKSSFIVFEDSELDAAVEWIMFGIFWNQGQVCSATSRVLIHEDIYETLLLRLKTAAEKIKIGAGFDTEVKLGPLVNQKQYHHVLAAIERGVKDGVRLVSGGNRPTEFSQGYYVQPTIFADVPEDHPLWNEEIFGPVVSIRSFKTESEAVQSANNSIFGLAGAVMSKDLDRCHRVARALRAGIIWINCSQPTFSQAPWGGYKQSGIGRELGIWGLENYLEVKQITTFQSAETWGWYLS